MWLKQGFLAPKTRYVPDQNAALSVAGTAYNHVMPAFKAKPKSDGKYERIQAQLRTLASHRQRILYPYFDSVIDTAERDKRIAEFDRERTALNAIASR